MLSALIDGLLNLVPWPRPESALERDTQRRTHRAYSAAWQVRRETNTAEESLLVEALRARNVPGSFVDATKDPVLATYVEHWRAGHDPEVVRAEVKRARSRRSS